MAHSFARLTHRRPVGVPLLLSLLHVRRKSRYRPAWLAWSDRFRTSKMTLPYFLKDSHRLSLRTSLSWSHSRPGR
jgi:hypothetical protein